MSLNLKLVAGAVAAALISASSAIAAVPSTSAMEGVLLSSGGGPAADGNYSATIGIYSAATGGTPVWTETGVTLAAKGGQFSYQLGSKTPLSAAALNLSKAWVGIQIGSDPELPRQALGASVYAVRASVAEALECSGCLKAGHLDAAVLQPYAKASDLSAYAKTADLSVYAKTSDLAAYAKTADLSSYAKTSDLADYVKASSLAKVAGTGNYADLLNKPTLATVASSGSYADLSNKPVLAKLGDACGTNLVMKGIKADGSYECVTAGIAADMINEVSNDLIWNQFVDKASGNPDVQIKDGFAAGVTDTLTFPDIGVAQKIWIDFSAGNSDISKLQVELFGPGMSAPYILYKGSKTGTTLTAKYNDTDALASGDMNKDWLGKNIKGSWSITVKDTAAITVPPGTPPFVYDGKFNWSVNIQTLSSKKIQIKGNLLVDGSVKVGTDAAVCDATKVGALRWNAATIEVCTGTEWRPHANGVTYTRWGRNDCPDGATTLWKGYAAGGHYQHGGSGGNTLCLTDNPSWPSGYQFSDANHDNALLYGTEYESNGSIAAWNDKHDSDMGCAVCFEPTKNAQVMIPGTPVCPKGWDTEYTGYIIAEHYTHAKGEWLCVDKDMQALGSKTNHNGNLWYTAEVECGAIPCGPYVQNRELTCAVCSR